MSRILITGGFGFVGGRLTRKLSEEHEVWVSSRRPVSEELLRLHGNPRRMDHSLLLKADTFPAFIDTVIHLASLNEIDSVKFPGEAIQVNIEETETILQNAITQGTKQFIYFSTAHIYGSPLVGDISENTLPVPVHPYAITHRAAEDYVVAATKQKLIQGTVFRLSNAFGAPVSPQVNRWTLLANDLCRQAVEKSVMVLKSNGCQWRDFICLSDVEQIVDRLVKPETKTKHIIYNLGSGTGTRILDMAELIKQIARQVLKKDIQLELPPGSSVSEEPELNFSTGRLLSDGFEVRNEVGAELRGLISFCKEHFRAG